MPTLAEIEREVARRVGPFDQFTVAATPVSTQTLVYVAELKTSADQGGYEGLYLLRRDAVAAGDHQRIVKTYGDADGYLEVDRIYTNAPITGEAIELVSIDPSRRLRVAVQRGLDRCFVEDRVQIVLGAAADEVDVTAALSWVTRKGQLLRASVAAADSGDAPAMLDWFRPFEKGGRVWLHKWPEPYPDDFYVSVLRPVSSRINGLSPPACPTITDVTTGGVLHADTVYYGAVATVSTYGTSPACPPVRFYPATDGANAHVARFRIPKDADGRHYLIYLSTDAAPKRVATITEDQRAAGVTITAVDTISATSPGAGYVDVRLPGTSTAAVQATAPALDADVLDVDLDYAATAAHVYAWDTFAHLLRPVAAMGMAPSESDVRRSWSKWIARLPTVPDRIQTAYPWPVGASSSWSCCRS